MCGIAGYYCHKKGPGPVPDLAGMTSLLSHRGPDDTGYKIFGNSDLPGPSNRNFYSSGLGHTRLAIIDLSDSGRQPMTNEDGTIWVSFNGEIYNYRELRDRLEGMGHIFKSSSDTETLVHGYEEWGKELPQKLRGMFAFAIWDNVLQSFFLVRDHFGIKPLYYSSMGETFLFASEMKSLLSCDGVSRELDPESLDRYLSFLYVPEPQTIYASIRALPPGHCCTLSNGNFEIKRFWKLGADRSLYRTDEKAIEEIRDVFEDSVKVMMVSDVPLGVFLSGGIDSTSILAMMTRNSRAPVQTFSIGFGRKEKHWDELHAVRRISSFFKTDHHEFLIEPDVVGLLPRIIWNFDQPFANPTSVILYLLAGETRRYVKVALAGTGGDEMFAGYPRYKGMLYYQRYSKIPYRIRKIASSMTRTFLRDATDGRPERQRIRRFLEGGALSFEDCYLHFLTVLDFKLKQSLYTDAFLSRLPTYDSVSFIKPYLLDNGSMPQIERLFEADLNTYLPFNQLVYGDRMSMAQSLEVRVPFVDQRLAEVASNITLQQKLSGGLTKGLFRRAMAPFLPGEVIKAPKQGLNLPIAPWLRNELRGWMEELLSHERLESRGYFRPHAVHRLLNEHVEGRRDHSLFLWALIVFEIWHQQYVDNQTLDQRMKFPAAVS